MHATKNETSERTLLRLVRALDRRQPVTVTYLKADHTTTVRTLEIHDVRVTQAGDIVLRAADRESREMRTFRLDRIAAYTIHTGASYTVPVEHDEDHTPAVGSLTAAVEIAATVTPLNADSAVALLADLLAGDEPTIPAAQPLAA